MKEETPEKEAVQPETPETPVEELPSEETTVEAKTLSVDRSAFNCPDCKGEGLKEDAFEEGGFVRCPTCHGTGKVS